MQPEKIPHMTSVLLFFVFASQSQAGSCLADVNVSLKPIPPAGYTDVARACACSEMGHCSWVWVGVKGTTVTAPSSDILNVIATYNPSRYAADIQLREEQIHKLQLENRVLEQQVRQIDADARSAQQQRRIQEQLAAQQRLDARITEAQRRHPDWDALLEQNGAPFMYPAVHEFLLKSARAGEVYYYLLRFPQEAKRVQSLSPAKARAQLARIEARGSASASR